MICMIKFVSVSKLDAFVFVGGGVAHGSPRRTCTELRGVRSSVGNQNSSRSVLVHTLVIAGTLQVALLPSGPGTETSPSWF